MSNSEQSFYVKNCALAATATGERASSLLELRDKLVLIDEGCIYFHFWGARMTHQIVHTQHHNDFARWVHEQLHDHVLGERLSIIDPTEFDSLELLRQELVEAVERRLDDYQIMLWTKKEDRFHFVSSTIIVFESTLTIGNPDALLQVVPKLAPGSIYYHFIDARARTPERVDDFSVWLKQFGAKYDPLVEEIQSIDPYFLTLPQVKEELIQVINKFFKG